MVRKFIRNAPKHYALVSRVFLIPTGKVIRTKRCRTNTSLIELAS